MPTPPPYQIESGSGDFTMIDLFAGVGGIRMGFQRHGGETLATVEWDKHAQVTYAANYGDEILGDITQVAAGDLPAHDVLLAGFPCQPFSGAGRKQGFMDTRGTLFFDVQRILAHHRPKAFLLENVKRLVSHNKGATLNTILASLRGEQPDIPDGVELSDEVREALGTKLNYQVDYRVLSANNFGVPQKRERVYIVGFDRDQVPQTQEREIAKELFDRLEQRTAITSLSDVLEPNAMVPERYTLSDGLWDFHKRHRAKHESRGNHFGYQIRSHADEHSPTLTARYYKDGAECLIDQSDIGKNPRKVTVREAARLQGFPEDFILDAVGLNKGYTQMGNSVAVPVIEAIAGEMKPYITNDAR